MNYTVQELALAYAATLVEYHEAQQSDVCDRERWVRTARDAMFTAQTELNAACERAAKLLA
jgi:hypothetical protein